jgi:hypothetical protein
MASLEGWPVLCDLNSFAKNCSAGTSEIGHYSGREGLLRVRYKEVSLYCFNELANHHHHPVWKDVWQYARLNYESTGGYVHVVVSNNFSWTSPTRRPYQPILAMLLNLFFFLLVFLFFCLLFFFWFTRSITVHHHPHLSDTLLNITTY